MKKRHYIVRVGDACSQLLNTIVFNGEPDESTSGRSYRRAQEGSKFWRFMQIIIDFACFWDAGFHCEKAYYLDIQRASDRILKANLAEARRQEKEDQSDEKVGLTD